MPQYEYEHIGEFCELGLLFEISQPLNSPKLTVCPCCDRPVKRVISLCAISTPKTNSDLKNLGFAKLVRRDDGIYENVTATGKESRIWDRRKPETMPDLHSRIRD